MAAGGPDILMTMLTRLGYQCEAVPDGAGALTAYKKAKAAGRPFDLVIMDLTIPGGMGGKEAIKEIRELDPNARAIVSIGYSDDPVMAESTSHGFVGTLAKPYTIGDVAEILSRILGEPS